MKTKKIIDTALMFFGAALLCVVLFAACASSPSKIGPLPQGKEATTAGGFKVIGPITGGKFGWPFHGYFGDISQIGYVEEEYFIEGMAQIYEPEGGLSRDGKWILNKTEIKPYRTRILVQRPKDPAKFNGTVVVEWLNVSSGYDLSMGDPKELYEYGFAYAGVSVQPMGVHGFSGAPEGLTVWDPERYSALYVSGDGVSYDIFTQAARAVGPSRNVKAQKVDPMGGLTVKKVIGTGGSQSGNRLLSYANGILPIEKAFDALISTVQAGGFDFEEAVQHDKTAPSGRQYIQCELRDDLDTPILVLNSEAESSFFPRQPQTDVFRYWDVAGAPHGPVRYMITKRERTDRDGLSNNLANYLSRPKDVCWSVVLGAAMLRVNEWITEGKAPPVITPMEVRPDGRDYVRDEYGNSLYGVRLPEVEVPIGAYSGRSRSSFVPMSAEDLKKLYPTHDDYVAKVTAAAEAARDGGFISAKSADEYIIAAQAAAIPE